jgi:hypothetical protein
MVTYRPVWITSDIIYNAETDAKNIELIVNGLKVRGIKANGYPNTGADSHINVLSDANVESNALIVDVYGGMDPGCIYEKANGWYKRTLGERKDSIVYIFSHSTMPLITNRLWLARDKTDNYDKEWFTGIAHPDEYLESNDVGYIEHVTIPADLAAIVEFIAEQAALVPISLDETQVQEGIGRVNTFYNKYNRIPKTISFPNEVLSFTDFTRLIDYYGLNYNFLQYGMTSVITEPATGV